MTKGVVAVVLAAGTASRFWSDKLLADLDGRPVLEHVLDRLRAAAIERMVVVLGPAADAAAYAVRWPGGARRIVNRRPEDGLASSLRLAVAEARAAFDPDAILIALGDQPRVDPAGIRRLIEAPAWHPVVIPRYAGGANPNPVLIRPGAYHLVDETSGDRGLGPVLGAHPELVGVVDVEGDNPDVDTPQDLARIRSAASRVP